MAEKKKRPVGRPRKVVDNTVDSDPPKILTKDHQLQMLHLINATSDVLRSYRFFQHPDMQDIIQLSKAHDHFQRGVFNDLFGEDS
ncbi:MAG: hypothetical protein VXZ60_02685 [Pseudomonadota bacterium]|nr:hypothetical protein [Pseudomonadota bacterium]MEC8518313.1 hypothetical protein [Pseudomonadota bacterium]